MRPGLRVALRLAGVSAAAGLVFAVAAEAWACSCREPMITAPANGEVDVPLDTRLWHADGTSSSPRQYRLTGPAGEVLLTTVPLGRDFFVRGHLSTPAAELTSGATYAFSECFGSRPCLELSRFTVGSRRAVPPTRPVERSREDWYRDGEKNSSCGSSASRFVIFKLDWQGLLLLVDVAGTNPFPADPASVLHNARSARELAFDDGRVWVGSGACTHWPVMADTAEVRFGAVNLAGAFSGWSEPTTVTLPQDGCACDLGGAGGAASGSWAIVAVGACLLLVRRRRGLARGALLVALLGSLLAPAAARADATLPAGYWSEPHSDYESRRRAFLEFSAGAQPSNLHSQIARLALGRPLDEAAIRKGVETVRDKKDGADFAANALLRIYGSKSPLLKDPLRAEIKRALLAFKYWMEEPGGDELLWMWNENHQINYHVAQYLAGQLYPDDAFTNNGKPGRWHRDTARHRLMRWIDLKAKTGFPEWDSNNCYVSIIAALLNLAELAEDPPLAKRAAMLLDVMFFDMAIDSFRGSYATSHGRTYPDGIVAGGLSEATTGLQRIAWGMGNPGGPGNSAANYLAAAKRYRVARTVEVIAGLMPEALTNRERQSLLISEARRFGLDFDDDFDFFLLNQAGKHSSIDLIERSVKVIDRMNSRLYDQVITPYATALLATYREITKQGKRVPDLDRASLARVDKLTYRTPDYQLSAAQDYRKGSPGSMQHIWQATLGPGTMVFTLHPGPTTRHWLGRLPRVAQHENLLIAVHDIPAERHPGPKVVVPPGAKEFFPSPAPGDETLEPRTLAVFRRSSFDEVVQDGPWTFGRKGAGYLALWSRLPTTWTKDGVFGGEGLVAEGRQNVWICQLGREKLDGPFAAWRARIAGAKLAASEREVTYEAPGIGRARFGWEGPLRIAGRTVPLGGYPRFDNPFTRTAYGQSRYVITAPGRRLVIDFSRNEHLDQTVN